VTGAPGDHARVCELLGREPRGRYEIVVRDDAGDPVVLKNAPLLDDGTPMPTRYWLIGPSEIRRIGRLESGGGVDRAEAAVDPDELAAAHARYAAERDAEIPTDHAGPRPSGGVGGTRVGVKCLHAHWAWHLAGGDDPVGRWIADELTDELVDAAAPSDRLSISLSERELDVRWGTVQSTVRVGVDLVHGRWLSDADPPRPEELTNALGEVADHLDDLCREHPDIVRVGVAAVGGYGAWAIAQLESGLTDPPSPFELDRATAEEIFRLAATEPRADRVDNPGLRSGDVDIVLSSLCVVVSAMRRLDIHRVTIAHPGSIS
jgi:hypothetical protein